jgi:hypothetical protein
MEQIGARGVADESRQVGNAHLLEMKMAEAAGRYGVPITVIPQRIRKPEATLA